MSSHRGRRSAAARPRQERAIDIPNDLPAPLTSRTPSSHSRATSQSRSEAHSAAVSRSHSPTGFSQSSLSAYRNFPDSPLEMDLGPHIESLAAISMNPDPVHTIPPDMLFDAYGDNLMGNNSGSASIGYQALVPPARTRRKELFVDPMPGLTQSSSSSAEGSRPATKRKRSRSSSVESSSNVKKEAVSTELGESIDDQLKQENDLEMPSTLQDRKGKGKAVDHKGKGKQREVSPDDSPIIIPDSPVEPPKLVPAKPLSEPLSAYTCPICFSAPTNATLTPCGHICCGACLFTAVKTVMQRAQTIGAPDGNEARCPVCRALIPDWDGKGGGVIGLQVRAIFSL